MSRHARSRYYSQLGIGNPGSVTSSAASSRRSSVTSIYEGSCEHEECLKGVCSRELKKKLLGSTASLPVASTMAQLNVPNQKVRHNSDKTYLSRSESETEAETNIDDFDCKSVDDVFVIKRKSSVISLQASDYDSDSSDLFETSLDWGSRPRATSSPLKPPQNPDLSRYTKLKSGHVNAADRFSSKSYKNVQHDKTRPRSHTIHSESSDTSKSRNYSLQIPSPVKPNINEKFRVSNLSRYTRCPVHDSGISSGRLVLFCQRCKHPICFECHETSHQGHPCVTMEDAAARRRSDIERHQHGLRETLDSLVRAKQQIKEYHHDLHNKREIVNSLIQSHSEHMHNLVNMWYAQTSSLIDNMWQSEYQTINNKITAIADKITETQEMCGKIDDILSHQQLAEFISNSHDFNPVEYSQEYDNEYDSRLITIFTSNSDTTVDSLGTLSFQHVHNKVPTFCQISQSEQLHSFSTRPKVSASQYSASGLSLTSDGSILVTDIGMDNAQMFSKDGDLITNFNTLPQDHPSGAIQLEDGRIVVSCRSGLKLYSTAGEFLDKVHDGPECPSGLALTDGGDLIVSDMASEGCVLDILSGSSLTSMHSIVGGRHAPVFQRPWYVTVDHDDNILVSDYAEHTVKIFSAYGGLLHEFGGKGCRPGLFFHPAGLTIDRHGNVLVADSSNDRVQLFTPYGELLGVVLNAVEHDLSCPIDLVVNDHGHLLVLQSDGKVRTFKYIW